MSEGGSIIARAARHLVGPAARDLLRIEASQWRATGPRHWVRWNALLVDAWIRDRINRSRHDMITEAEARRRRRSDTVFVFGSGSSLNDLIEADWRHMAEHDVFGFNAFYYQRWVRADFHLLRGGIYGELNWRPFANEVSNALRSNPHFANTVYVMQGEFLAEFANQMIGYALMPAGAPILRYRTLRGPGPATRALAEGLRHHAGTLMDAVNCAYCLGWKRIVLVGVDLYDSRYFYLPPDQTTGVDLESGLIVGAERNPYRGNRFDEAHATVRHGVIDTLGAWRQQFNRDAVELSVYNPRSLLTRVLPVHQRADLSLRATR